MAILALIAPLLYGTAVTTLSAQDVEICDAPALATDDTTPVTTTINVAEDLVVDILEIRTDLTHPSIEFLTVDVTSPEGTSLVLFEGFPGDTADLLLVWSDSGSDYGEDSFTCDCTMVPFGGSLSIFTDEASDGEWELTITDDASEDLGSLDEWCLTFSSSCAVDAPAGVTCEVDGDDIVLTWTPPADVDDYTIERDGVEIATVAGDVDPLYIDESPPDGALTYVVIANSTALGCGRASAPCTVNPNLIEFCNVVPISINNVATPTESPIEVIDAISISAVEAEVVAELDPLFDLSVVLIAPDGTSVTLHELVGDFDSRLDVVYADDGIANGSLSYACICRMQPTGPGTMADFLEGDPVGEWTLEVGDQEGVDVGTLETWCLRLVEEPSSAPLFIRGDGDGNGSFFPLLDALYILEFGFADGPEPPCLEAADADNSGAVFALLDALRILNFGFVPLSLPPEAPFPDCGAIDALDAVDLGCGTPPACP